MSLLIEPETFDGYSAGGSCQCHGRRGAEPEREVAPQPRALPVSAFDATLFAPAVFLQVVGGETDPDRIANIIFHSRHPEMKGRKIAKGEQDLIDEWRQIREQIVLPALKTVPENVKPPCGPVRCEHTDAGTVARIKQIVPLLNRYRGDLPLSYLVGWVAVESGGNIASHTSLDERGFFQIHPDESKEMRLSGDDHKRLSTDADFSVRQGIELVRRKLARVQKLGVSVPELSEAHLGLAKLHHWLPSGVKVVVTALGQRRVTPRTWNDVRSFVLSNRQPLLTRMSAVTRKQLTPCHSWDPAVGVTTVDKMFKCGRELMQLLGEA